MVLLARARARSQDSANTNLNHFGIATGSQVVVLNGRHFPAFNAGDQGTVLRVVPDAQNCEVLFEGKSQPVSVALRHLRVLSSPAVAARTEELEKTVDGSGDHWSTLTSLVHGPDVPLLEPSDFMDSTAGFAAGLAAVSGGGAAGAPDDLPGVGAPFSKQDGRGDLCVPGKEPRSDDICDETRRRFQKAGHSGDQFPHTRPGFGPVGSRLPALAHTPLGVLAADGGGTFGSIVSPLQGVKETAVQRANTSATNGEVKQPTEGFWHPDVSGLQAGPYQHLRFVGRSSMPLLDSIPRLPSDMQWHESRLKALEARLASVEHEHRTEVSSLRHALEECVCAIGTCARAIDTMCIDGGMDAPHEPRTVPQVFQLKGALQDVDTIREWERAAGALRDAANLGRRALSCNVVACEGSATGPALAAARQPIPARTQGPRRVSGIGSAPTPVSVEVVSSSSSTLAAPPPTGMDGQRRYLVAAPAPASGGQQFPVFTNSSGTGTSALQTSSMPTAPAWGSLSAPAPLPPASIFQHGPGPPQQLFPPGNLLGCISGLPQLPGLPCVLPPSGPPSGRGGAPGPGSHFSQWSLAN